MSLKPTQLKKKVNDKMAYTEKFQAFADAAQSRVAGVPPEDVDALLQSGAVALDIRDK